VTAYEQATATTETPSNRSVTETAKSQAAGVAGTAKDEAGMVAGTATQAASEVAGTAKEQVAQVASEAKDQISTLTTQAKQQVADQASAQAQKAASTVRTFGDQLQSLASGQSTEGVAADIVRDIAQRVQQIARKLETSEPQELLEEVRRYARNKPGMFLLGSAAAGFVTGRLVKGATSESDATSGRYSGQAADGYYGAGMTSPQYAAGYGGTSPEYSTGYVSPDYSTEYGAGTAAGAPMSGLESPTTGVGYPSTYGAETYPDEPRQNTGLGGAI
jgi:hypothetical protein